MRKERVSYNSYKRTREIEEGTSATFVIEKDYTQQYDSFSKLAAKIHNGTSYKLLFWLLANKASKDGSIYINSNTFEEFNEYLLRDCGPDCNISRGAFDNCLSELKTAGALIMVMKGEYKANAYVFWRDDVKKRKAYLIKEHAKAPYPFHNPDHDTKLLKE